MPGVFQVWLFIILFSLKHLNMTGNPSPVKRIFKLIRLEHKEITSVYFIAIMNGLILLAIPVGIQALIGFTQTNIISASIILLIVLIVVSVFTAGVLQVKQMQVIEKIQQKIFVKYAFAISKKIPLLKLSAVDNYYLPELINRFFDIGNLQKGLSKLLLDFPFAIIQILLGLLLLAFYHPVFIAFGVMLILVIAAILYFSGTKGLQKSIEESTYKYKVAGWLEEVARIIRSAKFSKSPEFFLQKTDENVTRYLEARTGHFKILELQYKTLIGFKTVVTTAMLVVGTYLMLSQQLNVGQFIAAEIVILTIINSVEKLVSNLDSVYDVLTAVEKIEQLTDKETETGGTFILPANIKGMSVSLKETSFTFPDASIPVISNISFSVKPGEKVCIRGEEGAGKSALLRLIAGSYQDFKGAILINDIPINNYNLQSLRLKTGVVISQQDIFEGSLMENICMGFEGADIIEVQELCNKVGLSGYINTLKNGFDTLLYATGKKLPGHATKKIFLVRAMLNHPALLLLEEPWAGLEEIHQQTIKHMLVNELKNTTVFVITKDEDFARSCDLIITLKKGGYELTRPKK
jgi:ABC-type bacteriocin/lantibiotic exporter with double-glycine peptidase domain